MRLHDSYFQPINRSWATPAGQIRYPSKARMIAATIIGWAKKVMAR